VPNGPVQRRRFAVGWSDWLARPFANKIVDKLEKAALAGTVVIGPHYQRDLKPRKQ
jgi:hypothetical protein